MGQLNHSRVEIFSLVKFHSILFSTFGLICGVIYSFGGLIVDLIETGGLNYGSALAFFALIGMPLIGLGLGIGLGICEGILYNILTKYAGSFEIKFH